MARDIQSILKLRVPIIVRLAHRSMQTDEVLGLGPGSIIELPQNASKPIDLMVNNVVIGQGTTVKIGEDFGLRVTAIGDVEDRVNAM